MDFGCCQGPSAEEGEWKSKAGPIHTNLTVHCNQQHDIRSAILLASLTVFGTWNRITFPAFLVIPGYGLLFSIFKR